VGGVATGYMSGYCGRYSDSLQAGILWAVERLVTGQDIVGGIATGYRPGYCGRCSESLQPRRFRARTSFGA